jgi:HrpA-like RNA helicase
VALLRAGRAGCLSAGQCYRLYSIETFESLSEDSAPAIQSTSLQSAVLYLKQLEVPDIRRVNFLHPPSQKHLLQVRQSLTQH